MSPFNHADKIEAPLLLIHGEADPNPGTYPMQSERLFAAIKGLGGVARLCLLPSEGHAYRARESIMHVLAEQDAWLAAHVKHAKPPSASL
jgi:dipeptidyl aminopeptidase/acylaminoacyl peptidase